MIMHRGFIKIWRKLTETSFYRDSFALHLAIHLLLKANHKAKTYLFDGKQIIIERGQLMSGRFTLSEETGIKPSTIRNKIALLRNAHFLDIKSNNKFSVITILNYETYQNLSEDNGHQTGQQKDSQRTTKGQPEDTNKNDKNDKNDKNKDIYGRTPFTPPTPDEVTSYCKERNNNIDAQRFIDFYQAKGWMIGKNKMKDWRAAVRTWEKESKLKPRQSTRRPAKVIILEMQSLKIPETEIKSSLLADGYSEHEVDEALGKK